MRLPIHLETQQYVGRSDQQTLRDVVLDRPPDTPLTAWFKSNARPGHQFAKPLLYTDYAELFTYHGQSKKWKVCKKMVDTVVGRMYFIMPNAGEQYFLRLLLNNVQGATSFAYLGTVEGTEYATYQQACVPRGLLQDDDEWHACLEEAVGYYSAARLRLFFCTIQEYKSQKDPYKLWLTFQGDFIGDLTYNAKKELGKHRLPNRKDAVNGALIAVEGILQRQGLSLTKFPSMPLPVFSKTGTEPSRDNDTWTIGELQEIVQERVTTVKNQKRAIFDEAAIQRLRKPLMPSVSSLKVAEAVETPTSTTFSLTMFVVKGTMQMRLLQVGLRPCS